MKRQRLLPCQFGGVLFGQSPREVEVTTFITRRFGLLAPLAGTSESLARAPALVQALLRERELAIKAAKERTLTYLAGVGKIPGEVPLP